MQLEGYAAILLTTLILLAPALLLIRRWTVPFGTFAFLFGVVATLTAAIESFDFGPAFLAPLIAGVVADVLYRRLRPGHRPAVGPAGVGHGGAAGDVAGLLRAAGRLPQRGLVGRAVGRASP